MWNLKLTLVLLAPFCVCLLVYCGLCAAYQVAPTYCEVAACLAFGLMGTLMTKEVEKVTIRELLVEEICKQAATVRRMQKQFFATKDQAILRACKTEERLLDKQLEQLDKLK
jgi:hypothetical protein